jgi:hypothetical protein
MRWGRVRSVFLDVETALNEVPHRATGEDLLVGVAESVEMLGDILDGVNLLVEYLRGEIQLADREWPRARAAASREKTERLLKVTSGKFKSAIRQMHVIRPEFDQGLV